MRSPRSKAKRQQRQCPALAPPHAREPPTTGDGTIGRGELRGVADGQARTVGKRPVLVAISVLLSATVVPPE